MPQKTPPCGNPECSASSDIGEEYTFGSGELSTMGYWEKPCHICARHFEKQFNVPVDTYWPYTEAPAAAEGEREKL